MIELQIRVNTLETVVYSNHEVYCQSQSQSQIMLLLML